MFFPENLKKNLSLSLTSKFRSGRVILNTGIFIFGLRHNKIYKTVQENLEQEILVFIAYNLLFACWIIFCAFVVVS